jgi:hypothetical protein
VAVIRKRMFAFLTLLGFSVVAVTSILTKGFDFLTVFVSSALGMIVFGGLGFLAGVMYERIILDPLVDSYRQEAREAAESQSQHLEMDLPVTDLRAGMRVCEQVSSNEGATLIRKGTVLTDRLISMLHEKGVELVRVKAQRSSGIL